MYKLIFLILLISVACNAAEPKKKQVRPIPKRGSSAKGPGTNMVKVVIWGSECKVPEGEGVAFGGQHQRADDGRPHTRILTDGKWLRIDEELKKSNPLQKYRDTIWELRKDFKDTIGCARNIFFEGKSAKVEMALLEKKVNKVLKQLASRLSAITEALAETKIPNKYESGQIKFALERLELAKSAFAPFTNITNPKILAAMRQAQIKLEIAAEAFGAEPPARACSKIVYDAKNKLYIIFGGDHFDYLTNDLWIFDPVRKKWQQRHPKQAPQPRAYHLIKAPGNGTIEVTSGITYKSKVDYNQPAYTWLGGGEWVYAIETNIWKGPEGEKPLPADTRTYRGKSFSPEFYMQGKRPNAAANEARLKAIPLNTWVKMNPPKKYTKNRDWGTAVIDTDHDLFLQWSGGHSAYCGTGVAQYHFATNRWEITFPTELPLGQNYNNTVLPGGYNFNLRPWMTGHTYKSYAYSEKLKQMMILARTHGWKFGHDPYYYNYDPIIGDWVGRGRKPGQMCHVNNMYSIQVCPTASGLFAWSKDKVFIFNSNKMKWNPIKIKGKMPGVAVDSSGCIYDVKRNRMLFIRKGYGKKNKFNGLIHSLDLKSKDVSVLSPANRKSLPNVFSLRECAYFPDADIFVWGYGSGHLVTFDPNKNTWGKIEISGKAPFGVSTGFVFDSKRKLFWVTDSRANIFCLRLDLNSSK